MHIASAHTVHGPSSRRRCRRADSRFLVAENSTPSTRIKRVSLGSPHPYDNASYIGLSASATGESVQAILLSKDPGKTVRSLMLPSCKARAAYTPSMTWSFAPTRAHLYHLMSEPRL